MKPAEKFWIGFFGTMVLMIIGAAIFAAMAWWMVIVGPLWGGVTFVILICAFAGLMHATTHDKEVEMPELRGEDKAALLFAHHPAKPGEERPVDSGDSGHE